MHASEERERVCGGGDWRVVQFWRDSGVWASDGAAAEGYRVEAARIQRGTDLWDVEFTGASDDWNCVGAGWKACELLHRPFGRRSEEGAAQGIMGDGCGVGRETTACWRGQTGYGAACRG